MFEEDRIVQLIMLICAIDDWMKIYIFGCRVVII